MKAELIAIGNEILTGFTINSNVSHISQELLKIGIRCQRQTVVADTSEAIQEAVREAMGRSDLVITTGGLGPTCDDISRHVVADLFDSPFHYDENVGEDLKLRYGEALPSLKNQATIPTQAKAFLNPIGTAPALLFEGETKVVLLPGVPEEMEALLASAIVPYLEQDRVVPEVRILNLFGLPESSVDPEVHPLQVANPSLVFGIYPKQGLVTIRISAYDQKDLPALEAAEAYLLEKFAENIFSQNIDSVEEAVQELFVERGLTLSTAESCTGGSIASRLTRIPGASDYFLGSVVSYANHVKEVLGVKGLEQNGAVSEETVSQMAEGVLQLTGSDYAVAVSGIAGPSGGTKEKPVGTVWCAIAKKGGKPYTWKLFIPRPREIVIIRTVNLVLAQLVYNIRKR